jgi:hypothetical protein
MVIAQKTTIQCFSEEKKKVEFSCISSGDGSGAATLAIPQAVKT